MRSQENACQQNITLYLDESFAFNRHLLSLIKQWDKKHNIAVHCIKDIDYQSAKFEKKPINNDTLQVIDSNGSSFEGAEALPIILKHLPFGKLAAAFYILPGIMWVTKQIYSISFTH